MSREVVDLFLRLAGEGTHVSRVPGRDEVVVEVAGRAHRLWIDPAGLVVSDEDAEVLWGPGVSAVESAARLMLVHWDGSLATREPHPTGWWTHRGGGFDPVPPWEVHRADHQG